MSATYGELIAVQKLGILVGDTDGGHLTREYLVRRAAAADRLADDRFEPSTVVDMIHQAVHYARTLVDHDRLEQGAQGPIPASAPRWDADPRGYARQEHAAWVLEHDIAAGV
ncbi:hypothetical protein [Streptomyces candidus]|uniref:Uncharacterized protein n=1 Tax=Streptomyces candidus TaxID=67283 RepID=A0A7X0LSV5_9ACTN|nr:hypothetical protein [Streptomyces candidus]MBB6440113.1 hypothetical protein [Streptomyces candidus]GHH58385.1 hypothetical protein GCM10018773_66530 [Streptomyces candidus]